MRPFASTLCQSPRRRDVVAATLLTAICAAPAAQYARTASHDARLPALQGYDPVTYFIPSGPQRGRPDITALHAGATYRFVSIDNAAQFRADPEKYVPQFGGHCSWAVSRGYTAPGSPTDYSIVDGKLYLNYNAQVHRQWQEDVRANIEKGQRNWPALVAK